MDMGQAHRWGIPFWVLPCFLLPGASSLLHLSGLRRPRDILAFPLLPICGARLLFGFVLFSFLWIFLIPVIRCGLVVGFSFVLASGGIWVCFLSIVLPHLSMGVWRYIMFGTKVG